MWPSSMYEPSILRDWSSIPDKKFHGANMGPIWGRQDPGGPHVGPMNFAIWDMVVIPLAQTKYEDVFVTSADYRE